MEIVVARELKSMNPSPNMFVHVSYFLEPNNLADKQISVLKGSWGRQLQVCVTLKTREVEGGQASPVSRGLISLQGMARVRQPLNF